MESTIVVKKYYGQWLLAKSTCWNLTFSDYVNWNAVTPNATSNPGPSLNFRGRPQCFQSTTGSKVLISFASFVNYYSYQNDHICHWITSQAFLLKLSWRVHSLPVSTWLAKPQLLTWRLIDLPNFPLGVTQFMKLTYLERKNIYFLAFQLNFNHTNMFLWIQEANAVVHKQSSLPHSDTPPPCIILLGGIVPLQERTSLISEQSLFFFIHSLQTENTHIHAGTTCQRMLVFFWVDMCTSPGPSHLAPQREGRTTGGLDVWTGRHTQMPARVCIYITCFLNNPDTNCQIFPG